MPALLLNTAAPLANPRARPSSSSRPSRHRLRCQAVASSSSSSSGRVGSSWATDYDLYELLGVEPSSPQAYIKAAYRALQKRYHLDIAASSGDAGPSPGAGAGKPQALQKRGSLPS